MAFYSTAENDCKSFTVNTKKWKLNPLGWAETFSQIGYKTSLQLYLNSCQAQKSCITGTESSCLSFDVTKPICERRGLVRRASLIVLKVFLDFIPLRVRFIKKPSIIHLSPCFQTRNVYWVSEGWRRTGGGGSLSNVSSARDLRQEVDIKMSSVSSWKCFGAIDGTFIYMNSVFNSLKANRSFVCLIRGQCQMTEGGGFVRMLLENWIRLIAGGVTIVSPFCLCNFSILEDLPHY